MSDKSLPINKTICFVVLLITAFSLTAQEINWFSIDQGGGTATGNDIVLRGVIGQTDVTRMEKGTITVAGGFLPLPADLIFENEFE